MTLNMTRLLDIFKQDSAQQDANINSTRLDTTHILDCNVHDQTPSSPTNSARRSPNNHTTVFISSAVSILIWFPDSAGSDDPSLSAAGGTGCLEEERVFRVGTPSSLGSSPSFSRAGDGVSLFEACASGSSGPWSNGYEYEYAQSGSGGRDWRGLTEGGRVGTPFIFTLQKANRMRDGINTENKR